MNFKSIDIISVQDLSPRHMAATMKKYEKKNSVHNFEEKISI